MLINTNEYLETADKIKSNICSAQYKTDLQIFLSKHGKEC